MRTMTRTIVLRRYGSMQVEGIEFEKDIPKIVDAELAAHLLSLGSFQDLTAQQEELLAQSDDLLNVDELLTELSPPDGFIATPSNCLGSDDLNGKRLLIRRSGGIGDVVIVAAFCQFLKTQYPDVYIQVGVREELVEFMGCFDAIDKVSTLDNTSLINVVHTFHYVVDFARTLGSELAGSADDKPYFPAHFERAGLECEVPSPMPRVSINNLIGNIATHSEANDVLNKTGIGDSDYVVLLLGTSNPLKKMNVETLQWIAETVASSKAQREGRQRMRVLCLGGRDDRVFHPNTQWVSCLTDLPLCVTAELVRRARVVIGADTGFTHFAASIGCPTLSVWGPTVPELGIGQYDADQRFVTETAMECAPCMILKSAHCKFFDGGYTDCMKAKRQTNIPEIVDELLQNNADHTARSITIDEVSNLRADLKNNVRIAVLLDHAKTYTGGGFYMWNTAKMLAELPMTHVTVFTDVPQSKFPYLQTDKISFGDKLSIVYERNLDKWRSSDNFALVVAQPPACGGAAVDYCKSRDTAKSVLVLYETPNYIAKYRTGADTGEPYWEKYRDALESADYVWCISKQVRDAFKEWLPTVWEESAITRIITPVINVDVADHAMEGCEDFYSHKTDTVVMIARNMAYKQLRGAVKTIGDTTSQALNRKINLIVIGDETSKLSKNVQDVWKANVRFLENITEEEKWEWLKQAKVLVHPSEFEGFGIPIAEGLYAGARVVAHPLPVIKDSFGEHVDYYTDEQEMVDTVISCFNDWDKEREGDEGPHVLAKKGRDFVAEHYTKAAVSVAIHKSLKDAFTEKDKDDGKIELVDPTVRIAYVGPWNARCGIAETTQSFTSRMNNVFHVFSYVDGEPLEEDTIQVTRCWSRSFVNYRTLLSQLVEFQPHVVHFQHEHSLFQQDDVFVELLDKLKSRGIKVVVTLHTYMPKRFTDEVSEKADAVVTTKLIKGVPDHWVPIDLPVEPAKRIGKDAAIDRLMVHPRSWIVGSFGMWQVHKGYDEFLRTFDTVSHTVGEYCKYLISAASPPKHQHLVETRRRYATRIGKGEVLLFTDYPTHDEVTARLEACSCIVFNYNIAHWTSSSAAIRTGMTAGVPVICTESPMFSEFENGRHVLKVQFGNDEQLANAIKKLYSDGDLGASLVQECDKYLASCTPEVVAKKHEELYNKLVFGE